MRIIKASFSKTFPINQYFEKVFLEAELNEGEDERQVLYDLKRKVENFFYESKGASEKQMYVTPDPQNYGQFLPVNATTNIAEIQASPKSQEETIIECINSCTVIPKDLNGLESFELVAKSSAAIKAVYDLKMMQLLKHNSKSLQSNQKEK